MGDPDGFLLEGNGQTYLYEILRFFSNFKILLLLILKNSIKIHNCK